MLARFLYVMCILAIIFSDVSILAKDMYTVAITQITSHNALDEVRKGVVDGLKGKGFVEDENLHITFSNAQGNIAISNQIAKKFVENKPDVIVAITTPSAQSVYNLAKSKEIPLVFASLSDPVRAGLVPAFDKSGPYITGTINNPPVEKQIRMMLDIMPNIKHVGVIVNNSEVNSVTFAQFLKQELEKFGSYAYTCFISKYS